MNERVEVTAENWTIISLSSFTKDVRPICYEVFKHLCDTLGRAPTIDEQLNYIGLQQELPNDRQ